MELRDLIELNKGRSFGVTSKLEVKYYEGKQVNCSYKDLIYLSLPNAETVYCRGNQLTELSLPNAEWVDCSNNQLTELSLPNAEKVYCRGNKLTELNAPLLKTLYSDALRLNGKDNVIGIDGIISEIVSKRVKDGFTIYRDTNDLYIVSKDGFNAHAKDLRTAIEDCNFKVIQSNFTDNDKRKIIDRIKDSNIVTKNDYRLLTGACSEGVEIFKMDNGIEDNEIPLDYLKPILKGNYGADTFLELIK